MHDGESVLIVPIKGVMYVVDKSSVNNYIKLKPNSPDKSQLTVSNNVPDSYFVQADPSVDYWNADFWLTPYRDGNAFGQRVVIKNRYGTGFFLHQVYCDCECTCRRRVIDISGTPQNLSLTPFAVTRERDYDSNWRETTPEFNYEPESEMASFPQYSFNRTNINPLVVGTAVRVFGGNSRRLTLILSTEVGMDVIFSDCAATVLSAFIAEFRGPGSMVLAYRDYGPLIRGEVWIGGSSSGIINITEVFELP